MGEGKQGTDRDWRRSVGRKPKEGDGEGRGLMKTFPCVACLPSLRLSGAGLLSTPGARCRRATTTRT